MDEKRISKIALVIACGLMGFAIIAIIFSNNPLYDGTYDLAGIKVIRGPSESSEPAIIEYYGEEISLSIPGFWAEEYDQIQNSDLNFTRHSSRTFTQRPNPTIGITSEQEIKETYVTYQITSWDGSPLLIGGYLYEPVELREPNSVPGVLILHGMFHTKRQGRSVGRSIAARGGVGLSISLPGHGRSEGPDMVPDLIFDYSNINIEGRQSPLFFLGVRAGLAGFRVLEQHPHIKGSNLGLVGTSWGGIHAQYISGVEHARNGNARLKMTFIDIAGGDILTTGRGGSAGILVAPSYLDPNNRDELMMDMIQDWDPMIYAAQIPKIFYNVGTNDELFTYASIQNTWAVIKANQPHGILEVASIPGGHHGIPWRATAVRLAVRDLWGGDVFTPQIHITCASPGDALDQVAVEIRIPLDANLAEVDEISVNYKNHHLGTLWNSILISFDASQFERGADAQVFTTSVSLPNPWIRSKTEVFASVRLSDGTTISSLPISEIRTTYLTYILPIFIVGVVFVMFWLTWKTKYRQLVRAKGNTDAIQEDIMHKFRWRNSTLLITEAVVLFTFTLNWVGASANEQEYWLNPLMLLREQLFTYMGSISWTFYAILGFFAVTVATVLYFPRVAALTNFLAGAIMATGVYIVKNHVLSLPDDPFLDSMELYIGSGVC